MDLVTFRVREGNIDSVRAVSALRARRALCHQTFLAESRRRVYGSNSLERYSLGQPFYSVAVSGDLGRSGLFVFFFNYLFRSCRVFFPGLFLGFLSGFSLGSWFCKIAKELLCIRSVADSGIGIGPCRHISDEGARHHDEGQQKSQNSVKLVCHLLFPPRVLEIYSKPMY